MKRLLVHNAAYTMKHPPKQIDDMEANALIERYIKEYEVQKEVSLYSFRKGYIDGGTLYAH